jgi:hypothetical protein
MIDYADCIKRAYPNILDTDYSLNEDENGLVLNWYRQDAKPTFEGLETAWLAVCKEKAITTIKDIRRQGLDKAAISAGVLAVYTTNYEAAVEYLANRPLTILQNGLTAESYLLGFSSKLNMTPVQFANYIVAENLRIGPDVYDVESRYLALAYAGDAIHGIVPINYLSTELAIENAVTNFKAFCGV